MPFDQFDAPIDPADVAEFYQRLAPQAYFAYQQYILTRTPWFWQVQMKSLVLGTAADAAMPAYVKAYVLELYNRLLPGAQDEYEQYILTRTPPEWQAEMMTTIETIGGIDVERWVSSVVSGGGAVSAARRALIVDFIDAEKASGAWDLTDDYWAVWGESSVQALTSLKQARRATAVAAPVFVANRGYTFNGTTQYLNTGFVPTTHGVAQTKTNFRLGVYERTDVSSSTVAIGAHVLGNNQMIVFPRISAITQMRFSTSATVQFTLPVPTSVGFTTASRNGNVLASCKSFKNGVELVYFAGTPTFADAAVNIAIAIGCQNATTPASFRASSIGFACIGAALTPAQELAQYNAIQAFATAIGANV